MKLRKIVKKIRLSPQLRSKLKEFCTIHGIKSLRPIIDVKTRWNSTYKMIDRAEYLKIALNSLCSGESSLTMFALPESEWVELRIIKNLLSKFNHATNKLSTNRHPTIVSYIPIMDYLRSSLKTFIDKNGGVAQTAAEAALEKLDNYKANLDVCEIPFISTIFHPGHKLLYFKEHREQGHEQKKIKDLFEKVYRNNYKSIETHNSQP